MIEVLSSSPIFGITISIAAYQVGLWINKKTKLAILNPLLISYALIIALLFVLDIPLSAYNKGGDFINMFLSPVTAVLALSVYRQREVLKKHISAVLAGSLAGSITSITLIYILSKAFHLEDQIMLSLIPKGITTPLAMATSESIGGLPSLTMLAVIITGITGNILSPILIKVFRVKNEIAQGLAIGTASHVVGTSKALEIGEVQGALSSIAIVSTGIITVILSLIIF